MLSRKYVKDLGVIVVTDNPKFSAREKAKFTCNEVWDCAVMKQVTRFANRGLPALKNQAGEWSAAPD